jgi:hypothetical protein
MLGVGRQPVLQEQRTTRYTSTHGATELGRGPLDTCPGWLGLVRRSLRGGPMAGGLQREQGDEGDEDEAKGTQHARSPALGRREAGGREEHHGQLGSWYAIHRQ